MKRYTLLSVSGADVALIRSEWNAVKQTIGPIYLTMKLLGAFIAFWVVFSDYEGVTAELIMQVGFAWLMILSLTTVFEWAVLFFTHRTFESAKEPLHTATDGYLAWLAEKLEGVKALPTNGDVDAFWDFDPEDMEPKRQPLILRLTQSDYFRLVTHAKENNTSPSRAAEAMIAIRLEDEEMQGNRRTGGSEQVNGVNEWM